MVARAIGLFVVTNVDDIVLLVLFFGQVAGDAGGTLRVVLGQYAGFAATLVVAVLGALGAGLLPDDALPYLGLVPIALGLRAAWQVWRDGDDDEAAGSTGVLSVAAVTLANGGDNIGVYVPVFSRTDAAGVTVYLVVFLVLVGVWCAAGRLLVAHPVVARGLARWGDVALPVVLIAIGVVILTGR